MKKLKHLLTTAFWEFITWIFWIIIIAAIILSCRSLDMMSYKEYKNSDLNRYKHIEPPDWQDTLKPVDSTKVKPKQKQKKWKKKSKTTQIIL